MEKPIAALIYDFDQTLCPGDMQEYGYMSGIGTTPEEFWPLCGQFAKEHHADGILAYMYMMREKARGRIGFTRDALQALGRDVAFYPGVETWFGRINAIGEACGLRVEHYIISSGVRPSAINLRRFLRLPSVMTPMAWPSGPQRP